MGRPPIGERAMTEAERKRRLRALARERQPVPKPDKPVPKPASDAGHAALAEELAQARARLATLEAQLASERQRQTPAEPVIARETLSLSAQQKLDTAIRQEMRRLAREADQIVNERVQRHMDEIMLPDLKQKIAQAQELFKRRRALMDKETFNTIRRALHPDSRQSISDRRLAAAFDAFTGLEKFVLDEKASPTDFDHLPDNLAEWDRMRARARASRSRKTSSSTVPRRR